MDQRQYLTRHEHDRLIRSTQRHAEADEARGRLTGPRRWIVVDLALSTGLRVSELAALTWADWSSGRSLLSVRRLKRRQSRTESLGVSRGLRDHLQHWRRLCGDPAGSVPIVPGRDGQPLTRSSWRRIWQRACREAGVPVLPIHGARHTVGHLTLSETGSLALVQSMLGHASPVTTANLYGHVTTDQQSEAADRLRAGVV